MTNVLNKKIIVYGEHVAAIQAMLDYDYLLGKTEPSIVGVIGKSHKTQMYKWGTSTMTLPTFATLHDLKGLDTLWGGVVMTSSRNVFKVVKEMIDIPIKNIFILAENVPERDARVLRALAKNNNVHIIGPASVGVLYSGDVKISHAGGLIENIVREKLFVKGKVAIVSKSGGMLNELMSLVTHAGFHVHTAMALGGDRFPITRLAEAVETLATDNSIEVILVLGETGGTQENELAELLKTKKINQKVLVHILGASSKYFTSTIQFGHAGAMAEHDCESADYKIRFLEEAGAMVVKDFSRLGSILKEVATKKDETNQSLTKMNNIPKDFQKALLSGDIRYTPNMITGVNYDYQKAKNKTIGEIIFKLWFGCDVNENVSSYIELIMKMLADHGAAVSGAHNTIVATRAGKDMISSVTSGLLTIGPRFGGAINPAALYIFKAVANDVSPEDFVLEMKNKNIPIPGIGHRVYSTTNNDPRVIELLKYVEENFTSHKYLNYFKKVEAITLSKKDNLTINIDGCIAVTLLDLFDDLKIDSTLTIKYLEAEALNGIFILARSIGLIAHHIDQIKLGEGLYRHPEYDIFNTGNDA